MTAKEKAQDLIEQFSTWVRDTDIDGFCSISEEMKCAKECVLICAKECHKEAYKQGTEISLIRQKYWEEVIEEIKKS